MKKHLDDRGWLMEILRGDDLNFFNEVHPFGQVYCTTVRPGVIKAWHRHEHQTDRICCVKGRIKLAVFDDDPADGEDAVFDIVIGDENPCLVMFTPNLWHGFMNVGEGEAIVINVPDMPHDRDNPDEERCPFDSLPYDWAVRNR